MNASLEKKVDRRGFYRSDTDWIIPHAVGVLCSTGRVFMYSNGVRMEFSTLYVALRSRMHICQSIDGDRFSGSDLAELFINRGALASYVSWIRDPALFGSAVSEEMTQAIAFASRSLRQRRTKELVAARKDLDRSVLIDDILGRHNPGAAMMAGGRAIDRIDQRREQLQNMLKRIGFVKSRLYGEIYRHRKMYEQLVAALGGRRMVADRATLISSRASTRTRARLERALREAWKFERMFRRVCANPFRRNASHTADDLRALAGAYRGILANDPQAWKVADACVHRLRQGIVWVFARHELEMDVLFPLSFLLADISDSGTMAKKAIGGARQERVNCEPSDTDDRIVEIIARVQSIRARISKMPQGSLGNHSPSPRVLTCLADCLQYLDQRDLKAAKRRIEAAFSRL